MRYINSLPRPLLFKKGNGSAGRFLRKVHLIYVVFLFRFVHSSAQLPAEYHCHSVLRKHLPQRQNAKLRRKKSQKMRRRQYVRRLPSFPKSDLNKCKFPLATY